MTTSQRIHRLRQGLALPLALILALLLPLEAWAWGGTGHFVLESIGYTDGAHAHAYTVAPNFRQASGSLNQANSAISSDDAADVYVNFDYDTAGKSVYVVYTTDGSAPNKSNGMSVPATFSKYAEPNRTWYATIPAQVVGTTVNYVFYISDSDLASAWGRISGTTADRNISQYETGGNESDGSYFTYSVCSRAITVTSNANSGAGSLRQAIIGACPGATIIFSDTLAGETITLISTLVITQDLSLDGSTLATPVTLSGNDAVRAFKVTNNARVTLDSLAVVHGRDTSTECIGESCGGGLYNDSGIVAIHAITFTDHAAGRGAAIYNAAGAVSISDSFISDNAATVGGGGGIANYATLIVAGSTISNNTTPSGGLQGGGIFNADTATLTATHTTFQNNAPTGAGGGIANQGTVALANCLFIGNSTPSTLGGGGVYNSGNMTLETSTFSGNSVTNKGGAIYSEGKLSVTDSLFSNNTAGGNGGAIINQDAALTVANSTFTANSAANGGALVNYSYNDNIFEVVSTTTTISNSTFSDLNTASAYGGAIYNRARNANSAVVTATLFLVNSTIAGNSAQDGGGVASHVEGTGPVTATLTMKNNIVYSNAATGTGPNCADPDATLVGNANNLFHSTADGCPLGAVDVSTSEAVETIMSALVDNGGPTPTRALVTGSPALDAGDDTVCPTTDQRGLPRPYGTACDIGAYEATAELELSKSVTPTVNVPYHDVVTYTLILSNTGIGDDTAFLTDTLPTSTTFASWIISPTNTVLVNREITWNGLLTAGHTLTWTWTMIHTGNYADVITNTAEFSGALQSGAATAEFHVIPAYVITPTAGTSGSINPATPQTIRQGNDITFTITPDTGYYIADVLVDGASQGAIASYTFTNVIADHTISAAFAINTYEITPTAGVNGNISPATAQTVNHGDDITFTITSDTGYHITNVLVDGTSQGAIASYTFTNVTADHTLSATFAINTYEIIPTAGIGGSISPATTQTVNYGDDITFTITPDTGYHIADVLVDGASQGTITSYTFTNVTADHTLSATFAINTYEIIPTVGTGGSISPATTQTVNHGDDITFIVTPDPGYHITDVLVDGASQGIIMSYTFENITANHAINALFNQDEYTLTVNSTGRGTVTWTPSQTTYLYGDVVTLTATPDEDWYFKQWTGDASGPLTQTNITMNTTKVVTATFMETLPTYYTLTLGIVGNGIITPGLGTHSYLSGTVVNLSANPADDWQFDGWSGDLESASNTAQVTMDADKVITATFSLIPIPTYTLKVYEVGQGTVTLDPPGGEYNAGTAVTLTATADPAWYFGQWSGDATGILTQTTVTLDTNKVVTATFIETPPTYYTLTLSIVGSGVITPAAGMHPYLSGTQVDLSANPADGWKFDGWSGDLESTNNLAQVTMNTHKTITAAFNLSATTNHTPTADAGPNQNVIWGDTVTLDGSGSSDPDAGDTLAYRWAQTGGDTVTLSNDNIESPTFTATTTGTLTFTLTVTDSGGLADSDSVSITVTEKRYQTYLPLLLK